MAKKAKAVMAMAVRLDKVSIVEGQLVLLVMADGKHLELTLDPQDYDILHTLSDAAEQVADATDEEMTQAD